MLLGTDKGMIIMLGAFAIFLASFYVLIKRNKSPDNGKVASNSGDEQRLKITFKCTLVCWLTIYILAILLMYLMKYALWHIS